MNRLSHFLRRLLMAFALAGSVHGAEPEGTATAATATTNAPASVPATAPPGTNGPALTNTAPTGSTNVAPAAVTNSPSGPSSASAGRLDFSAFRLVGDRNIFNPNRSARSARGGEARKPARVDTVSLVGTLSYHKGDFAFFDGSSATFRKAVRTNETVADFRVTTVGMDEVTLEVNGKPVTVRVGARFRREEDGPWEVTSNGSQAGASTTASTSSSTDTSTNNSSAGNDSGSTGAANDILARLRQKREQELKNENP